MRCGEGQEDGGWGHMGRCGARLWVRGRERTHLFEVCVDHSGGLQVRESGARGASGRDQRERAG